ncbi:MAG: hypothetical protein K2H36_05910 [Clostridia bacterium]|nr:hypothetical protein [Clostridia bacterium]
MEFWWLGLAVWIVAIALIVAVFRLRNNRKLSMQVIFVLSLFLLVFKSVEFASYRGAGKALYPVEFSHLSYFILGATMVSGIKKLRPFAGFCSLASGLGFLVATTASPASVYNSAYSIYFMIVSIAQHLILLFAGLLLLFAFDRYSIKDIWISVIGVAAIFVFSALVYNRIIYKDFANRDEMVIIEMITGTILRYVLPTGFVIPIWLRVGTVIVLLAVLIGAFAAYYLVNNKIFDKREKNGNQLKDTDYELGIKTLIIYFINKKNNSKPPLQKEQGAVGDNKAEQ